MTMQKDWTKEVRHKLDEMEQADEYLLLEEMPVAILVEISEKLDKLNQLLMDRTRLF